MSVYFYEIFNELCESTSAIPSQVAQKCHFHRSTISAWKSNHTAPSNKILAELSNYFGVPVSFLSQSPPFNDWEEIDKDYRAFLYATGIPQQYLTNEYQFDFSSEKYNLKRLVLFIDTFIASAEYKNGKWMITKKYDNGVFNKKDIWLSLTSILKELQNMDAPLTYHDTQMTQSVRNRLIWAIQLGLDAADGVNKKGIKKS